MKKIIIILLLLFKSANASEIFRIIDLEVYNKLEFVLFNGTDPNQRTQNNLTPIIYAAKIGDKRATEILLNYNANVNLYDISGANALHYSARLNNLEIAQLLLKEKINVDKQDFLGKTALMRSLQNKHSEISLEILKYKPNLLLKNNEGKNSLEVAIEYNQINFLSNSLKKPEINNLETLNKLKKYANLLQKAEILKLIDKQIIALNNQRLAREAIINFSKVNLSNLTLKVITYYPCYNSEINTTIAPESLCLKSYKKEYFYISALKKPIRNIKLENFTLADHKNFTIIKVANNPWLYANFIVKARPVNPIKKITIKAKPLNLVKNLAIAATELDYNIFTAKAKPISFAINSSSAITTLNYDNFIFKAKPIYEDNLELITTKTALPVIKQDYNIFNVKAKPNLTPLVITLAGHPIIKNISPQAKSVLTEAKLATNNKPITISNKIPKLTNPNISKDILAKNYTIDSIRTNEWLIRPAAIPLSIIDSDNLGPNLIFNRKFTYQKNQQKIHKKTLLKVKKLAKSKINTKAKADKQYYIQLGLFSKIANATKLKNKAEQFGNANIKQIKQNNQIFNQVILGPYADKQSALTVKKQKDFINFLGKNSFVKSY